MTRQFLKAWIIVSFALFFISAINGKAFAMEAAATAGKFKIQPYWSFGEGLEKIDVGTNTNGDTVSISGGGGAGIGLIAGYGVSRNMDIDYTFGYSETRMTPAVSNAKGTFDRTFILVTVKYRIPVANRFHIKLGAGAGYYMPGDLDIDLSDAGFPHDVVSYKDSVGVHATAEFELFFTKTTAMNVGFKLYSVTYHASSGTRNGMPAYVTNAKVKELDGSGFDFMLSLAKYF